MNHVSSNQTKQSYTPADHLANERTFLAWIRTGIGIMALGFVLEKFAVFMKQIAIMLEKYHAAIFYQAPSPHALPKAFHHEQLTYTSPIQGYSSIFGAFLVALGVLICLLAFIKYKRVEKQLDSNNYQASMALNIMLMATVVLIGIFLFIYLFE